MTGHLTEEEKRLIYDIATSGGSWEEAFQSVTGRSPKTIKKPFNAIKLLNEEKREGRPIPSIEKIVRFAKYGATESYISHLRLLWRRWSESDGIDNPMENTGAGDDWDQWRKDHLTDMAHAIEGQKELERSRALFVEGGGFMIPKHPMEPIHEQIIKECLKRDPELQNLKLRFEAMLKSGNNKEALDVLVLMTPLLDRFKAF